MTFDSRPCAAVAVVTLVVASAGCGDLGGRWEGSQRVAADRLNARHLEQYARGSPERAVLEWYAALQRRDVAAASRFYSSRTPGTTPSELRLTLTAAAPAAARTALGPLSSESERGGGATVATDVRIRWEAPNGRAQEVRRPQAFSLVREGGRWRFVDTYFPEFLRDFRPQKPLRSW